MFSGAVPAWDIDTMRLALAGLRALWLAALLSSGGALLFRALEPTLPRAVADRLGRLIRASLLLAGGAWLAWTVVQAVVLLGEWQGPAAIGRVLAQTQFGRMATAQIALLGLAALSARRWRVASAALALGAVAVQATHLHAWAMEGGVGPLSLSVTLHLLAAAAWLGGLLPLHLVVRHANAALAAGVLRRFSRRALLSVLLLAVSACAQGSALVGGVPGLVGTAYGWVALVKLSLLAILLAFAAHNRWRLLPRLARPDPRPTQAALRRSLARETVAGGLVVLAAALLSALPPGMHAQPVWPFALQPSLITVREDADFAREALFAGLGVLLALALAALAAFARPVVRWPALAGAALLFWLAAPHLALLLIPATPTSFYRSPTGFAADGIAEGAALYPEHCARCHGADGHGDGPQAAHLPLPPADLTAPHLWMHPDGELFWWLSHGMAAPDGAPAMPGFAGVLSEDERWQVIDYIRAHNAGLAHAAAGAWSPDLRAPDFDADCAGGRSVSLREMRGRAVRLEFADSAPATKSDAPALVVLAPRAEAREASGGDCIAADPELRAAYAIVTGLPPDRLSGVSVLIDAGGWLREALANDEPDRVAAALHRIAAAPLAGNAEVHDHAR